MLHNCFDFHRFNIPKTVLLSQSQVLTLPLSYWKKEQMEFKWIKVASNISKAYKKLLKISELALKKQSSKLIELKLSLWMSIKIFTVSLQQQIKKPTNFSISCLSEQYTMGKLLSCFLLNLFLQLAPKFKP